jgi:hypothetical protein
MPTRKSSTAVMARRHRVVGRAPLLDAMHGGGGMR